MARTRTAVRFCPVPFEAFDVAGLGRAVDLVFSSPPFHTYEVYSREETQSSRFRDLGAWLARWLLPVTDRAWSAVAPGGHLAYYLAGRRITRPLRAHMAKKRDCEFRGAIACRRGSKRSIPLWVWRKKDGIRLTP